EPHAYQSAQRVIRLPFSPRLVANLQLADVSGAAQRQAIDVRKGARILQDLVHGEPAEALEARKVEVARLIQHEIGDIAIETAADVAKPMMPFARIIGVDHV